MTTTTSTPREHPAVSLLSSFVSGAAVGAIMVALLISPLVIAAWLGVPGIVVAGVAIVTPFWILSKLDVASTATVNDHE